MADAQASHGGTVPPPSEVAIDQAQGSPAPCPYAQRLAKLEGLVQQHCRGQGGAAGAGSGAIIPSAEAFPLGRLPEDVVWHALGFLKDLDLDQRRRRQAPAERPPLDPLLVRAATKAMLVQRNVLANVCAGWRRRLRREDEGDGTSWLRRLFVRPKPRGQRGHGHGGDDDEEEEEEDALGALLAGPPPGAATSSEGGSGVQVRLAWLVAALPVLAHAGRAQKEEVAAALIHLLHAAAATPGSAAASSAAIDQGGDGDDDEEEEEEEEARMVRPPIVLAEFGPAARGIADFFWASLHHSVPFWTVVSSSRGPSGVSITAQLQRPLTTRDEAHAIKMLTLGEALLTGREAGRAPLYAICGDLVVCLQRAMFASLAELAAFGRGYRETEGEQEEEDASPWGIRPTSLRRRCASLLALMGERLGSIVVVNALQCLFDDQAAEDNASAVVQEAGLLAIGALAVPCTAQLVAKHDRLLAWASAQLRHPHPMVRCVAYWTLSRLTQAFLHAISWEGRPAFTNARQAALVQRAATLCERGMAREADARVALAAARALADLIEFLPHGRVRRLTKCFLNVSLREMARTPRRPGPYHVLGSLIEALGPEVVTVMHLPRVLGAVLDAWARIGPHDHRQLYPAELVLMLMHEVGDGLDRKGSSTHGGDDDGGDDESRRLLQAWLPRCVAAARPAIEAHAAAPATRLRSEALGAAVDVCATALDLAGGDPAAFLLESAPWLPQAVLPLLQQRGVPPCVSVPLHILLSQLVQLAPAQLLPSLPEWFPGLAATVTDTCSRRHRGGGDNGNAEDGKPASVCPLGGGSGSGGEPGGGGGVDLGLDGHRRGKRCDNTPLLVLNNAVFALGRAVYHAHREERSTSISTSALLATYLDPVARALCRVVASAPVLPGEEEGYHRLHDEEEDGQEEDEDAVLINLDDEEDPAVVAREERRLLRVTAAAALGSLAIHAPEVVHRQLLATATGSAAAPQRRQWQRQPAEAVATRWAALLLKGQRLQDGFTDREELCCGILGLTRVLELDAATPASPHALLPLIHHPPLPLPLPPLPPTGAGDSRQQRLWDRLPPSAVLCHAWVTVLGSIGGMLGPPQREGESGALPLPLHLDAGARRRVLRLCDDVREAAARVLSGEAARRLVELLVREGNGGEIHCLQRIGLA